ncbi:MAG: tetratricopeptide repeat protein [Bdellovibrionaceae bacterium]|nr:tetratricopeptide repeat protein [Pseudobdellovibrionaceae bacterium]
MNKWIVIILSTAVLWGCSTSDEASDSNASSSNTLEASSSSSAGNKAESASAPQPTSKKALSELDKAFDNKQYKEMFEIAGAILSQNPHDAHALNTLALYHTQKSEWGAARLLIERALEKNKDLAGLYNNLGVIALRENNLELAYVHFKTAYAKQSNNPNVLNNLGSVYVKYLDYSRGEKLIEDAYSYLSDSASVTNNLAIIKRSQGQYDEAASLYRKIIDKDPRNVSTLLNYAILQIEYMKKYDEGEKLLNKLEFLESGDPYVRKKITDLNIKVQAARK